MKVLSILVLFAVIALGCTKHEEAIKVADSAESYGPIVRLHFASTGRFFCSGTVISATKVLTAGHCFAAAAGFMGIARDKISVRSANGAVIDDAAEPLSAEQRSDQGLVIGNFAKAEQAIMITDSSRNIELWGNSKLISCGFPFGGKLFCIPMKNQKQFNFGWSANSFLYPGMSGGPVFDSFTGAIVGINSAVREELSIFATTLEIFANLNVSE